MLRIFRVQAGESGQAVLQAGQMMRRPLLGLAVAGILLTLPFAARPLRFLMGNRVMGWLAAVSMNYYLLHQNLAVHLKRLGVPPSVSAEPVSYTHLDVYKRQDVSRICLYENRQSANHNQFSPCG